MVEAITSNHFNVIVMDTYKVAKEEQTSWKIPPVILRSNGKWTAIAAAMIERRIGEIDGVGDPGSTCHRLP